MRAVVDEEPVVVFEPNMVLTMAMGGKDRDYSKQFGWGGLWVIPLPWFQGYGSVEKTVSIHFDNIAEGQGLPWHCLYGHYI